MFCSRCNTQNLPTALKCIQCGVSLVTHGVNDPEAFRAASSAVNRRMYAGYGALGGFMLGGLLCGLIPGGAEQTRLAVLFSTAVGFGLGRYIAWKSDQEE